MRLSMENLENLARDVAGVTRERWGALADALKDDASMNDLMRLDWQKKPRDSEAAIRDYYRESHIWFLNTFYHGRSALLRLAAEEQPPALLPWQETFVADFEVSGPVLDYGGGFFNDSWPLVLSGYEVVLAEVRGPVTEFVKRYREMVSATLRTMIGLLEVDEDLPILGTYHGAVCFEVLEHLLHPAGFARHLHEHLAPRSPFAFSASFGDTPHAPYHVARNAGLGLGDAWGSKLEGLGFQRHWKDQKTQHYQVWRRP